MSHRSLKVLNIYIPNNVIHRDLKLGNLFLSKDLELKVGDFGLSERVLAEGKKVKAMSGTPNYIAPEILLSKDGHSYEVDVWAIGVITYTMLIGRPPFQSKTSKQTCSKIKKNMYSFPEEIQISETAKDFIRSLLKLNPSDRPKLNEILNHKFFHSPYPKLCPKSSLYGPPKQSEWIYSSFVSQNKNYDSPIKIHKAKRTRSNVKHYLMQNSLSKDDQDGSQDNGQNSNIILGDSKFKHF